MIFHPYYTFTDAGGTPPPTPTPGGGGGGGGGWYGEHEYRRKRQGKKVDEWMDGVYADLTKSTKDVRAEAAAIVKPFADTKKQVPQVSQVDWAALHQEAAAVKALIALWEKTFDDDEDEELMFLAMH